MANYLSPRVVINEVDNSILVNSFTSGPILVLGEAPQGPDDSVYTIINLSQHINYFGNVEGNYPAMYAAKEYLAYGNDLKFKRVTSVKSVKISSDITAVLTESETVSAITGATIRIPSGTVTTPYLDSDSADVVVYINTDSELYKVYVVDYIGNDGTDEVYAIVWDSYGSSYPTSPATVIGDLYIGHAEPAYTKEVKFPNPDAANATATMTFTNTGESFNAVSYYVTTYTNGSALYGETTAPTITTVAETGATQLATGDYTYRYAFSTSLGVESPVSVAASAAITANKIVELTLPELPTGFSSYVIYRDIDAGGFKKVDTTTNRIWTDDINTIEGAYLGQCPITIAVNGVDLYSSHQVTGSEHDIYYNAYDGRTITGEYKFEYVYTTSADVVVYTLIAGTSPVIEVGTTLYIMEPISLAVEAPNVGSYIEGTVNTAVRGIYLTSTFLGTTDKFLYFNGTGTVTIPTTATIQAYYLLGETKYYYTDYASGFTYYKATAKGRGVFGNEYVILTTYSESNTEYNFQLYGEDGLLESFVELTIDDLVNVVNETSVRIKLELTSTAPALTGFVAYDETYSTTYVKYYSADPAHGYDGYFDISPNDFIANIDQFVATSLSDFDSDLADLLVTANLISSTESTLLYDLMVIPGWSSHPVLADAMYTVCTTRPFISGILDLPSGLTPILAFEYRNGVLENINNSHMAIFWNYAKIYDSVNRQYIWLPPSVFAIRAIAYTEQSILPFAAAAGLKRGILPNVVELEYNPTLPERDLLFAAQVNPLATISGIVTVWGNKTSQKIQSMLSDFNVRRMLDKAENAVYTASQSLLFDPNDAAERKAIILSIQPIFDVVAQKRGLTEFSIVDSTTEEDVNLGIARFTINLRPTATIKVIVYDVIINKANLG
jgi:hypothetical protein